MSVVGRAFYGGLVRWFPGEAGEARDAASSPGLPRGTQSDQEVTPRETAHAPRATPPEPSDESPGDHLHARSESPAPPPEPQVSLLERPPDRASLDATVRALADAFLTSPDWTVESLTQAGAPVAPDHRVIVATAAAVAVHRHRDAPRDAPRALVATLLASARLAETFTTRSGRRPVVLRRVLPAPTAAREPCGALPRVDTIADLAGLLDVTIGHLDWLADTRLWNRRAPAGPLHHYRYRWRHRPGRTPRLLEAPLHLLKTTQRRVLDELLVHQPLHDAAHGFVRGRTALTGARHHVGRDIVVSADLESFFAAVPASRIYGVFRRAGLPEPVAHALTGICTHAVPVAVIRAMPPGGSPEERHRLRTLLATPHLPQGSPTSPALANLTLRRLDSRLAGWAAAADATYTRYADDLAFSGGSRLAARPDAFLRGVERIVADSGHTLNRRKSHVRRAGVRQSVTGVVVNSVPTTGRREYDVLKATLHNCRLHGPASQNHIGHPDFRAHLSGRVGWVEHIHPSRGARLREIFDGIEWTGHRTGEAS